MRNYIRQPLYIIFIVAVLLSILSFLPTTFSAFGITFRPVNMFSDLTKIRGNKTSISKPLLAIPAGFKSKDSLNFKKGFYPIQDYAVAKTDNLAVFYHALSLSSKKKVHIAYFGDSLIEGDIITQDIRTMLQNKFGGRGVGFVPIINFVPGFRTSIGQQFSDNWRPYKIGEKSHSNVPFGINGETFVPYYGKLDKDTVTTDSTKTTFSKADSWVHFEGVKQSHNLDSFYLVKLFYSNPDSADSYVSIIKDGHSSSKKLEKGTGLKVMMLNNGAAIHSITLSFKSSKPVYIYGASFEDTTGVYVDNLSMRGVSGLQLSGLSNNLMQQFATSLNIKLLVLQYGINVVHTGTLKYDTYQKSFSKTINTLKDKFPGSGILVNSVSDRSTRKNGDYITMPEIPVFADVQQSTAQETNTAFWNLFDAMGGDSSMIRMVNSELPLANKDYTHFKAMGGKYIATDFYYSLLYDFEKYEWELTQQKHEHS